MSTPSFLSQRLSLVQEQQLELTMLAEHAKRGTGHQRRLALEIKRARALAMLPYVVS